MTHGDGSRELGVGVSRSAVRGFSAARLRRYRQARKATIEDLADAAGVSAQTVSAWETGRAAPTPELLAKVAAELRLTVADLVPIPSDQLGLSDLRVQAGMTQGRAAEALGISATLLGRIEKGRKEFDDARAQQLAELYGAAKALVSEAWQRDRDNRQARATRFRDS
ncbi:helix-turn-helix domain-containing protein [Rhodococcus sp. JT-3]|uniref:helix-turn-helix domain-containing protein n=1 Tax=Rhodococcus sp. JT-3 TaxID=1973213 RepID=UPI000AD5CB95|nr:helix-turn-helix transcriptional regulator [Rhodococcus sp. JT-3]